MIALGASLTRTPYGQHLQGPRKNKFKIHNSVNADDINKDETAGEHDCLHRSLSRSLQESGRCFWLRVHADGAVVQTSPWSATPR